MKLVMTTDDPWTIINTYYYVLVLQQIKRNLPARKQGVKTLESILIVHGM